MFHANDLAKQIPWRDEAGLLFFETGPVREPHYDILLIMHIATAVDSSLGAGDGNAAELELITKDVANRRMMDADAWSNVSRLQVDADDLASREAFRFGGIDATFQHEKLAQRAEMMAKPVPFFLGIGPRKAARKQSGGVKADIQFCAPFRQFVQTMEASRMAHIPQEDPMSSVSERVDFLKITVFVDLRFRMKGCHHVVDPGGRLAGQKAKSRMIPAHQKGGIERHPIASLEQIPAQEIEIRRDQGLAASELQQPLTFGGGATVEEAANVRDPFR